MVCLGGWVGVVGEGGGWQDAGVEWACVNGITFESAMHNNRNELERNSTTEREQNNTNKINQARNHEQT